MPVCVKFGKLVIQNYIYRIKIPSCANYPKLQGNHSKTILKMFFRKKSFAQFRTLQNLILFPIPLHRGKLYKYVVDASILKLERPWHGEL